MTRELQPVPLEEHIKRRAPVGHTGCRHTGLPGFTINPSLFLGQETRSCLEVMLTHQGLRTDVEI